MNVDRLTNNFTMTCPKCCICGSPEIREYSFLTCKREYCSRV